MPFLLWDIYLRAAELLECNAAECIALEDSNNGMRAALDAVLAGEAPAANQTASLGCNIKWKAGNEPDYFSV